MTFLGEREESRGVVVEVVVGVNGETGFVSLGERFGVGVLRR